MEQVQGHFVTITVPVKQYTVKFSCHSAFRAKKIQSAIFSISKCPIVPSFSAIICKVQEMTRAAINTFPFIGDKDYNLSFPALYVV